MQPYSLAFSRVSRAAVAANPELKARIDTLLARAYHNMHGLALTDADPSWVASISAGCLQLCLDARVERFSTRELVHLFENVIRISEEHLHEARRHSAMASNVFYLKETALDAIVNEAGEPHYSIAAPQIQGAGTAHSGRLEAEKPGEPIA